MIWQRARNAFGWLSALPLFDPLVPDRSQPTIKAFGSITIGLVSGILPAILVFVSLERFRS
jgi:phage major head subunit gpT-like protein